MFSSMPGDMNVVLPALTPRQHAVPRRYEETKPVHIQGYAHTRIIGIHYMMTYQLHHWTNTPVLSAHLFTSILFLSLSQACYVTSL